MSFEEFEIEVMKSMQERFDEVDVRPERVEKLQGQSYESGFYLIPSSIHEVLAMPDGLQMKAKDIDAMVDSVNSSEVAPEERLSGHSYHYDREEKLFESGIAYEERKERERDPGKWMHSCFQEEQSPDEPAVPDGKQCILQKDYLPTVL